MTVVDRGEEFEVVYTFDKGDLKLDNVRLLIKKGEKIPSITGMFPSAFLIENETEDCFGIGFTGLGIDAGGTSGARTARNERASDET